MSASGRCWSPARGGDVAYAPSTTGDIRPSQTDAERGCCLPAARTVPRRLAAPLDYLPRHARPAAAECGTHARRVAKWWGSRRPCPSGQEFRRSATLRMVIGGWQRQEKGPEPRGFRPEVPDGGSQVRGALSLAGSKRERRVEVPSPDGAWHLQLGSTTCRWLSLSAIAAAIRPSFGPALRRRNTVLPPVRAAQRQPARCMICSACAERAP